MEGVEAVVVAVEAAVVTVAVVAEAVAVMVVVTVAAAAVMAAMAVVTVAAAAAMAAMAAVTVATMARGVPGIQPTQGDTAITQNRGTIMGFIAPVKWAIDRKSVV